VPDRILHIEIFLARGISIDHLAITEGSLKIIGFDELERSVLSCPRIAHELEQPTLRESEQMVSTISAEFNHLGGSSDSFVSPESSPFPIHAAAWKDSRSFYRTRFACRKVSP
jgi:hypothetical protein